MVVPSTVHAAFHKAAHYFGVDGAGRAGRPRLPRGRRGDGRGHRRVDGAGGRLRAVVRARRRRPDHRVAGGPAAAGDPLPRRRVHRRVGAAVRRAARAAGAAVDVRGRRGDLDLGRHPQVRLRPQGHLAAAAPRRPRCGGRSSSPRPTGRGTRCSTPRCSPPSRAVRSPGRGRWCSTSGDEGTSRWRASVFEAVDRIVAGVAVRAVGGRAAGLDPGRPDVRHVLRRVHGVRRDEGARLVRPAADVVRRRAPPTIHLSVSAATLSSVDELLADLASSVAAARAAVRSRWTRRSSRSSGRSTRPPSPTRTSTACSRRPAWSGCGPSAGLALPARMAEVNAMLDVASPALREALLVAFLDRLSRPVRSGLRLPGHPGNPAVVVGDTRLTSGRRARPVSRRARARPATSPALACPRAPATRRTRPRPARRRSAPRSGCRAAAPTGGP